jgi:hypothetical protein
MIGRIEAFLVVDVFESDFKIEVIFFYRIWFIADIQR